MKMVSLFRRSICASLLVVLLAPAAGAQDAGGAKTLDEQLRAEPAAALAAEAEKLGDPVRGAIVFYQPYLACTRCHLAANGGKPLGPDLTQWSEKPTATRLVEAILEPSKSIRKGFESTAVVTVEGKTLLGLVVEQTGEAIALADGSGGPAVRIARSDVEQIAPGKQSLMPAGLVNSLASRQQFLDLVAYLVEIAARGPARALELKPAPALYAAVPLPEYEQHLDHAGLISRWDAESQRRGAAIYARVCANCHGTLERPGSLPAALRFGEGRFKSGSDPVSMYRTLTRGFGLMVPQTWMTPGQKYDVIGYVREAFLKEHNPSQYTEVDAAYLAGLPKGDTLGPAASTIEPWVVMDYGPSLTATYEIGTGGTNFAHKGIAIRLDDGPGGVSRGRQWVVFDTGTLRAAAAWNHDASSAGGKHFIDWQGINFDGQHQLHPHVVGSVLFANSTGPGWADPADGSFSDRRTLGRDGRHYGPLPREWGKFLGYYENAGRIVLAYRVGDAPVWELFSSGAAEGDVTRTLHVGRRTSDLVLQVAQGADEQAAIRTAGGDEAQSSAAATGMIGFGPVLKSEGGAPQYLSLGVNPATTPAAWEVQGGRLLLRIPRGDEPLVFAISIARSRPAGGNAAGTAEQPTAAGGNRVEDPRALATGGPRRWPQIVTTEITPGPTAGPFASETLGLPLDNPWACQMRLTGLDFFGDDKAGGDRAAVCTWDGDVWSVSGLRAVSDDEKGSTQKIAWQRIASGLFQPLGLKIVDGQIHVACRDQIVILRDLNGDGETDFYECFNDDHQVTEHFHEFAMGLQTDAAGNFYYAKSARHALPAVVPHHGTLLRVSRDGTRTDIVATGFRAANGVCVNSDGTFVVTDQEGHWNPKNRINWVEPGGFYGNMFGYSDVTDTADSAMRQPLCWITQSMDRSPAELLWVPGDRWGGLAGSLLNLSYGYGKLYVVPHERVAGQWQGGMCALALPPFATGIMRGRFHPTDGALYVCGMFAWAGSATQPGGFYRIRHTGGPSFLPVALRAGQNAVTIGFDGELDASIAGDAARYVVKTWQIRRTAEYGSDHFNERRLAVSEARVAADGRSVTLVIPALAPTWCMEIQYALRAADGRAVEGTIDHTIHALAEPAAGAKNGP
ncbi:MAG TPA: DUF6797 domain-containing protein [Pirellulales bacterium]|nr:DUF6797 domain-containing protein [Pirellulales bacterium]